MERLPLRTNAVNSWGDDMSGAWGFGVGLTAPTVVEEAVERVDWAVGGRDPRATLRGRAGEDWVGGGMGEDGDWRMGMSLECDCSRW